MAFLTTLAKWAQEAHGEADRSISGAEFSR